MSAARDGQDRSATPRMPVGARGREDAGPAARSSAIEGDNSRMATAVYRLLRAWRRLPSERRLAAGAALGLFLSLFLPWYQETVIARGLTGLKSVSASMTGWQSFSFVEAAVLLVAAAVLILLFVRAEGQAFHVPGGDGGVITAAGLWACLLIVWRMFDQEGTTGHGQYATTSGIEWGIFVALAVAGTLTYAGSRIRRAHEPEPALPGEPEKAPPATARPSAAGPPSPRPAEPRQSTTETELIRPESASPPRSPGTSETPTRRRRPRSIAADRGPAAASPYADDDPTVISPARTPAPTPSPEEQLTMPLERPD